MIIIKNPYKEIINIIGFQEYNPNISYRPLLFNTDINVEEGTLLYNVFSGMLVLANKSIETIELLVKYWFYVPAEFDDIEFVNKIRHLLIEKERINEITTYTIFPTTNCNARCSYCFEIGRKKNNMTSKTALKVADYITTQSKGANVVLRWFGGEPLLNINSINLICSNLKKNKIDFESKMATNGFLFDKQLVMAIKNLWNLSQVQITIDGRRDYYNKIKQYRTSADAFSKVLSNIHLLTESQIKVIIRLNISDENSEELISLVKNDLIPKFRSNRYVSIYSHLLSTQLVGTADKLRETLKQKHKLDEIIYTSGFSCQNLIPTTPKIYRCIADDKCSVTILPDGKIGLCEHYTEDKFISDIETPEIINEDVVQELRDKLVDFDICKKCAYYPRCIKLRCCPEANFCNSDIMAHNIGRLKKEILGEYSLWKFKLQSKKDE